MNDHDRINEEAAASWLRSIGKTVAPQGQELGVKAVAAAEPADRASTPIAVSHIDPH